MVKEDGERFPLRQQKSFPVSKSSGAEYLPQMARTSNTVADFKLRLRMKMADRKLSANGLSLMANLSRDTVRKLLDSETQLPSGRTLMQLATALNVPEGWLLSGEGADVISPAGRDPEPYEAGRKKVSKYTEILGTAAGSHDVGAFQFVGESSRERILIPEGIAHLPGVYAINVSGDSMHPEHKSGEVRFALPSITPQLGDSVVVEFRRDPDIDPEAMIGHLLKRRPMIQLGKINPANVVEIEPHSVLRLHRLATYDELAGRGFF